MAPACVMILLITLLGNIFYGCYIIKMRNLHKNDSPTFNTSVVNSDLSRNNNDIEMVRLQNQTQVQNTNQSNTVKMDSNKASSLDNSVR